MQGYKPATLHCRSPGCDQKWHIQFLWLGFSSYYSSWYRILQQYNQSYPLIPFACAENQLFIIVGFVTVFSVCLCFYTNEWVFVFSWCLMTICIREVSTNFAMHGNELRIVKWSTSFCTVVFELHSSRHCSSNKYILLNLKVNVYRYIYIEKSTLMFNFANIKKISVLFLLFCFVFFLQSQWIQGDILAMDKKLTVEFQ